MVRNVDKRKVRHLDGYTVIHWFPKLKGGGGGVHGMNILVLKY